jgi:hypothetical protein
VVADDYLECLHHRKEVSARSVHAARPAACMQPGPQRACSQAQQAHCTGAHAVQAGMAAAGRQDAAGELVPMLAHRGWPATLHQAVQQLAMGPESYRPGLVRLLNHGISCLRRDWCGPPAVHQCAVTGVAHQPCTSAPVSVAVLSALCAACWQGAVYVRHTPALEHRANTAQ